MNKDQQKVGQNQQGQDRSRDQQNQQYQQGNQGGQQRGGSGNFANDPERASEAGRKGGERSHDNDRSR